MKMKKLSLIATCLLSAMSATAQIQVENVEMKRNGGMTVISFDMHIDKKAVDRNHKLIVTPVVFNGNESENLPPVVIESNRTKKLDARNKVHLLPGSVSAMSDQTIRYETAVNYQRWQAGSGLWLDVLSVGCCSSQSLPPVMLAITRTPDQEAGYVAPSVPSVVYEPAAGANLSAPGIATVPAPVVTTVPAPGTATAPMHVAATVPAPRMVTVPAPAPVATTVPAPAPAPVATTVPAPATVPSPGMKPAPAPGVATVPSPEYTLAGMRSESGSMFFEFAVGQSKIDPNFRNNTAELARMRKLIESILNDPYATITEIRITGFSSPEGTYATNMNLSELRAIALKEQIKSYYGLPENLFNVSGASEDWATLSTLVRQGDIAHKDRVIEIINNTGIFKGRERDLMMLAGGTPYRQMSAQLFSELRRVEYRISYAVSPYSPGQSGSAVSGAPDATRSETLSLNELFRIAESYEPGSDEYYEVFRTAANLYPDSDAANMNAASGALMRGDTTSASRYLSRVRTRDTDYWHRMGVLAQALGDRAAAAVAFDRAGIRN